MSAASMLNEIQFESLQETLNAVNARTSPTGCTGIPDLDAFLLDAAPQRSFPWSSLNRGEVIEVQGPPASGKTHLLYHLVVICIMPTHIRSIALPGWNRAAVVLDTDASFDVTRVYTILHSKLSQCITLDTPASSIQSLTRRCMSKMHVMCPTSSTQLAATLMHLPSYHSTHMTDDELGLVAVDSISAFYWPDRLIVERLRTLETAKTSLDTLNPLHHVLVAIQKLRVLLGPVVVLCNWGLNPLPNTSEDESSETLYKQHLHPFPTLANHTLTDTNHGTGILNVPRHLPPLAHHITLSSKPITPFGTHTSIQEALEDEDTVRKPALDSGEVTGLVRTAGSPRIGRFSFFVGAEDISVRSRNSPSPIPWDQTNDQL